jgi:hypothetical protein
MHRQFLGYGLWHYDLVELLKQWYVAEKFEENQRARVEDGRFSGATTLTSFPCDGTWTDRTLG